MARRTATLPRVETLESRSLMAALVGVNPGVLPADPPNETLDRAVDLGVVSSGEEVVEHGSLGTGPAGAADVEWYSFTLDQPARVVSQLERGQNDTSFQGVVSLFNNDPWDSGDPYDLDGHRLLDQVVAPDNGGVATLDQLLGPGTYFLAVSGAGNLYFHPLLAGSGLPGSTGSFDLGISITDAGLSPGAGPVVLTSDPAPNATLSASPFVIRLDLSGSLDPGTIQDGQTVQLTFNPTGTFGDQNDVWIPLASTNFSASADELQLILAAPLAIGYYKVSLAGDSSTGQPVLATTDGTPLGMDAEHPLGQDYSYTFQVTGAVGYTNPSVDGDDTPATAHDLGDVTSAGLVQVTGAIGDDPFYSLDHGLSPGNQVDMYHCHVSGSGRFAFVAEVFAGRIGSPLEPGISLFYLDPTSHSLEFVAGDINSYNTVQTTDGLSSPLYTDPVLYASLTAGDYYIAVASGSNTPSPLENQPLDTPGLFDPNVSHSGQDGLSTGPYVLNLLVRPAGDPPQVLSTSPSDGATLDQPPTQLIVKFDKPVNMPQIAFQTFQVTTQDTIASVYIQGSDGTKYFPRFESYDAATDQATFLMLDGLANGDYELHLSGANGLDDLAGNPLVGNDPSGDYVVRFTVDAPARGTGGNPLEWTWQEGHDDIQNPQDLGVLFPRDLVTGVTISRDVPADPSQAPQDTADVYQFQVLQEKPYTITLTGNDLPDDVVLTLTDASGQPVTMTSLDGGQLLEGPLRPGTYLLTASGSSQDQTADICYQIRLTQGSSPDNAPPLVAGPAPALAVLLDSVAPPTPPAPPPPVSPPPPVTPAPVSSPPPVTPAPVSSASAGKDPAPSSSSSPGPGMPIAISAQPQGGPVAYGVTSTDVVALASSTVGGARGSEGLQAASTLVAQNVAALPSSSTSTEVITAAISLPSGQLRTDLDASPGAPKGVDEQAAMAGVPMIAVASTGLEESVIWFMKSVRGLPNLWAMSNPLRLSSVAAPKLAPAVIPGIIEQGVEMLSMSGADQVSESDTNLTAGDWKQALPILIASTCLTTAAYTGCRGLGRREECRGEKANSAPHWPKPGLFLRPVLRTIQPRFLPLIRGVLLLTPLAAAVKAPLRE